MFRLEPNPTFKADVPLSVPGLPDPLAVVVTYRHKTRTAMVDWLQRTGGRPDFAVLAEVVENIEGIHGPDGGALAFTPAVLSTLIDNYPVAHEELFHGYLRELAEAKKKT